MKIEELFERYPETHLPASFGELLLTELTLVEQMEPGFCQRVLIAAQTGMLTGDNVVSGPYGCAYGQGANLDEESANDLLDEMREKIMDAPYEFTPLERIVECVEDGDIPETSDDLAFLEEVLISFLAGDGKL